MLVNGRKSWLQKWNNLFRYLVICNQACQEPMTQITGVVWQNHDCKKLVESWEGKWNTFHSAKILTNWWLRRCAVTSSEQDILKSSPRNIIKSLIKGALLFKRNGYSLPWPACNRIIMDSIFAHNLKKVSLGALKGKHDVRRFLLWWPIKTTRVYV